MTILFWLVVKHFLCDFPLQATPWIHANKGIYGHWGGITHAALHGFGTLLVLWIYAPHAAGGLAMLDVVIHYHIDFAKMWLGERFGLRPDNSEWYWILLGFDQLLHYFTYFLIAVLAE